MVPARACAPRHARPHATIAACPSRTPRTAVAAHAHACAARGVRGGVAMRASGASMLALPDVTLACVETRRVPLAIEAMRRCTASIAFADALLLTTQEVVPPAPLRRIAIAPLADVRAYSAFMLDGLHAHVATGHVLVAQWDGFVLDAGRWDEAFLEFDYIGAPWPDGTVGNGGFSLRSRRLLEALRSLRRDDPHPEDACICVAQRAALERRHGIRFAPLELARRFAFERVEPDAPTFGVHGLFNFDLAMGDAELAAYIDRCDDALVFSVHARRLMRNCMRSGRRQAARAIMARRMRGPVAMRLDALKLAVTARLGRRRIT